MNNTASTAETSIDLTTYLFARREALLHRWKTACEDDSSLMMGNTLSRDEFNDHAPTMLEHFGRQLRGESATTDLDRLTNEHGRNRWHKGYSLRELLIELNHLTQCVTTEITTYAQLYRLDDLSVLTRAYERLTQFSARLISGSVEQYTALEQNQAAERAGMLRQALDTVTELTRQRGQFLRRTSHDLRGGLGVIEGAASLLNLPHANAEKQASHLQMLRRNLKTVGTMLGQLSDLSRLEAGQEEVNLTSVDVGALLHSMVESTQPLAAERNLVLQGDGPESMLVETDPVLVQRIVQNLLLNALQHTQSGLISVAWSHEDSFRWTVSVQDTGTGLPVSLADTLTKPLKPTTDTAAVFEQPESPAPIPQQNESASSGEGIGLHIVKWLCQLLNASIDIETRPEQGTLIRVRLPMTLQQKGQ